MNLINELELEKAHSETMAAAAERLMREVQALERTIAALVETAGGCIDVPTKALHDLPEIELFKVEQPHNMTVRFFTKRRSRRKRSGE